MSVTQLMMAIFIFIKKGTYKNILLWQVLHSDRTEVTWSYRESLPIFSYCPGVQTLFGVYSKI